MLIFMVMKWLNYKIIRKQVYLIAPDMPVVII